MRVRSIAELAEEIQRRLRQDRDARFDRSASTATIWSLAVDHYCLSRGVTTAVDAGSAGCGMLAGFRAFAIEQAKKRLLAFLDISCSGLAFGGLGGDDSMPGELELLKLASVWVASTVWNRWGCDRGSENLPFSFDYR